MTLNFKNKCYELGPNLVGGVGRGKAGESRKMGSKVTKWVLGSSPCFGDIPAVQLVADASPCWRTLKFFLCLFGCFDKASNVLQMLQSCGIILHFSNKRELFLNVFTDSFHFPVFKGSFGRGRVLRMINVPLQPLFVNSTQSEVRSRFFFSFSSIWGAIPHWLLWKQSRLKRWQPCFSASSTLQKSGNTLVSWAMF